MGLTMDSKLKELMENPEAVALLEKYSPGSTFLCEKALIIYTVMLLIQMNIDLLAKDMLQKL